MIDCVFGLCGPDYGYGAVGAAGGCLEFLAPFETEADTGGAYVARATDGVDMGLPYLHLSECRKYRPVTGFFHIRLLVSMFICNFIVQR